MITTEICCHVTDKSCTSPYGLDNVLGLPPDDVTFDFTTTLTLMCKDGWKTQDGQSVQFVTCNASSMWEPSLKACTGKNTSSLSTSALIRTPALPPPPRSACTVTIASPPPPRACVRRNMPPSPRPCTDTKAPPLLKPALIRMCRPI